MQTIDDSTELLLVKRQRAALLSAKLAAVRNDGLPFYQPHAKQDLFHRSTARRRGAFTGNRFGKSHMGCAEDCAWLRGERPWIDVNDPARRSGIPQRPVKGLVIANDWDKVKEIWTGEDGKLWRFLPKGSWKCTRNHSGAVDVVHYRPTGSSLRFDTVQSFKSNPLGSESSDWDFIHVDEPCPEQMFKAAARGLMDRNGSAWFTLTALREPWITDAFETDGIFAGNSFMVTGSIFDNVTLTKDAIDAYIKTLTPEEVDCRVHGLPFHKAGLIYKSFKRDKHVLTEPPVGWSSFDAPPMHWPVYFQIDPHPQTPTCILFCTVDPFGRRYYYKDIFHHASIEELSFHIREHLKGRFVVAGRADPLAFIDDPLRKMPTMAEEFARCGVYVEKAPKALAHGILKVQGELAKDPATIFFTPTAKRTLWEISRYHWDETEDKPVDADDHAMECLYRHEICEPKWLERQDNLRGVDDIIIDRMPPLTMDDLDFSSDAKFVLN